MNLEEFIKILEKNGVDLDVINMLKDENSYIYFINELDNAFDMLDLDYDDRNNILLELWNRNDKIYNFELQRKNEYEKKQVFLHLPNQMKKRINKQYENSDITTSSKEEKDARNNLWDKISNKELDFNQIVELLPDKNDDNFKESINLLIKEIVMEISVYNGMALSSNSTSNDLKECKKRIIELKKLNDDLCEYRDKMDLEHELKINNLIFYSNFYNDLKTLTRESIDNVLTAIEEFRIGKLEKDKSFTNCETLKGLKRKRKNEIRIAYVGLSKNTYMLLSAYIKRQDNDKYFRDTFANVYSNATNEIEYYRQNYNDEIVKKQQNEEYVKIKEYLLNARGDKHDN